MTFNLTIKAGDIAGAMAACAQFVDSASKIPILKATRIAVSGAVTFTATNVAQTVVATAQGEGSGVVCVDTQALASKVSALKPSEHVSMTADGQFLHVSQGRTKWKLPVLLDDFPPQPTVEGKAVELDSAFMVALKQTAGALAPERGPVFSGVWVDGKSVMGTDGREFRLNEISKKLPACILPSSVIAKLPGLFPDGAKVVIGPLRATFSTETLTVSTQLVEAQAADWKRIVANAREKTVHACTVPAAAFISAVKRASTIRASGEKAGSFINLQLRFRATEIEVFTRNSDGEEGSDFVACEGGADADVGFAGGMLIENAESLDAQTIAIAYGTQSDPIIMSAGTSYRIVMPRMFS